MASASRPLADEPIAIIGLDCKLPGRASTPQGYWDLLLSGENTSTKVPENRFNVDAFYHPDHERFGLVSTLIIKPPRPREFLPGPSDAFQTDVVGSSTRKKATSSRKTSAALTRPSSPSPRPRR